MTRMDFGKGLLFLVLLAVIPVILLMVLILVYYGNKGVLGLFAFCFGLTLGAQFFKKIRNKNQAIQFVLWSFCGLVLVCFLDYFFFPTLNLFLYSNIGYFVIFFIASVTIHKKPTI